MKTNEDGTTGEMAIKEIQPESSRILEGFLLLLLFFEHLSCLCILEVHLAYEDAIIYVLHVDMHVEGPKYVAISGEQSSVVSSWFYLFLLSHLWISWVYQYIEMSLNWLFKG